MLLVVPLILVSLSSILLICLVVQRTTLIAIEREKDELRELTKREKQAVTDIISIAVEIVGRDMGSREFLEGYLEYLVKFFNAAGGALLESDGNGFFNGHAVSGVFPPLKDVPEEIEYELILNPAKHKESMKGWTSKFSDSDMDELCGEKNFAVFINQCPIWFPERFLRQAPEILIAPIKVENETKACVIMTFNTPGSPDIYEKEGDIFARLNITAAGVIEFFEVFGKRQEHEAYILANREENIMQLASGIMHNIGNAMTIAKLSVQELCERFSLKEKERPETLILEEMLPVLKEKLANGTIQDFLENDPVGKDYFKMISELLLSMRLSAEYSSGELRKLSQRLSYISEIVELQQHFAGEFGTSGTANLTSTINSAISIFEGAFNKNSIRIKKDLDEKLPELQVDPAIMTQVLINIMKNAAEAITAENNPSKDFFIEIKLSSEKQSERDCAVIEIKDNGPGMGHEVRDHIFEFGFSTKAADGSRGRGLHSCVSILRKYEGSLTVDSSPGNGAIFRISIPLSGDSCESSARP